MKKIIVGIGVAVIIGGTAYFIFAKHLSFLTGQALVTITAEVPPQEVLPLLAPPAEIRGIYLTASTAYSDRMEDIIRLIKKTNGEVNAVVIDVQDDNGRMVIDDRMKTLVRRLRFLKIFPIARIVVFQNNSLAKEHPEWAIKTSGGELWRDRGGRHWLDPSSKEMWEHVAGLARQAIDLGFLEVNFDYIRFASEGVKTAVYPLWRDDRPKTDVIQEFADYMRETIKKDFPGVRLTADIFGYTFLRRYDLGIGQSAPALAARLDGVYPMIYPSHYDPGNFGFDNPAAHPYEVVLGTLEKGKEIFAEVNQPITNISPWIQDFDLGAVYTPDMVRVQMKAIEDAGLGKTWFLWNARNNYRDSIFQ